MADLGFDFNDEEYEQDDELFEEPQPPKENNNDDDDTEIQDSEPLPDEQQNRSIVESNALIQAISNELSAEDDLEDELLADENITPIERVYGYRENDALINRLLLAKELPNALGEISLKEAVEDILPVMFKLSSDKDDTVRETFTSELDQTILYFYKNTPETFTSKNTTFSDMFIRLLLDQSSSVASLGQQAIVIVVTELDNPSIIQSEIIEGVIEGLLAIIDGKKKTPRAEDEEKERKEEDAFYHRVSIDEGSERRSSVTPGFETSLNVHYAPASDDDLDQGELSLAKIACISLVSSIVNSFSQEQCVQVFLPIIERFATDPLFYVRKEAASSIGQLAQRVDASTVQDRLLPLFKKFSEDQIWHVRRSCVLALPALCSALPEQSKHDLTTNSIELFHNDVSRNVRNTLADMVGELVANFLPVDWEKTRQPGKLPEPLLDYFLSLGSTNQTLKLEVDRTFVCAYNFPAVVLTAGVEYWDSHLRETYLNLTKDYQIKVRCTFAHSLHDIASIIGPERTERDLVQIFALYLMDLDDVKQGVLEHLADFLSTLAVGSRNEYIPILAEVWDGVTTNWHLRNILTEQLMDIAMLFDASRVVEHILPLVVRACDDKFAAVRETGASVFPIILDIVKHAVEEDGESLSQIDGYGDDVVENKRNYALALLSHVMERLDEFARSETYRGRLVFAQTCKALIDTGIGASDFASFFLPRLAPLAYDPIVNVRIAASRVIGTIYTNEPFRKELSEIAAPSRTVEPSGESAHALEQMTYRFALDKDSDVRSFVMSFVDPDTLEKQREQEENRLLEDEKMKVEPMESQQDSSVDSVSMDSEESSKPAENASMDSEEIQPTEAASMDSEDTPSTEAQSTSIELEKAQQTEIVPKVEEEQPMDLAKPTLENDEDEIMLDADPVISTKKQ